MSLKDDAVDSPVEQELPDTLAPTAAPPAGAGKRNNLDETAGKPRGASRTDLAYCYPPPPLGDSSSGSLAYPPATPHLTRAPIEIATRDSSVGRGVFATEDIPAGQVIEISPVLVLSQEEYKGRKEGAEDDGVLKGVEASQLRGYVFTWGRDGSMAVALGIGAFAVSSLSRLSLPSHPAGSLFNHSASPNVTYSLDYSQYTISYRTAKPVQRGDELLIFYGHSVRFSHSDAAAPQDAQVEDVETAEDGWGGLGNLDSFDGKLEQADDDRARLAHLKSLTPEQLAERDEEVVGPHEAEFPWRKVTEIIDPEDAELSLSAFGAFSPSAVSLTSIHTHSDLLRHRPPRTLRRRRLPVRPQAQHSQQERAEPPQARPADRVVPLVQSRRARPSKRQCRGERRPQFAVK